MIVIDMNKSVDGCNVSKLIIHKGHTNENGTERALQSQSFPMLSDSSSGTIFTGVTSNTNIPETFILNTVYST